MPRWDGAAWLAFFRRRPQGYEQRERLRPGMVAALAMLGAGCVGFGVAGQSVLSRIVAPAAASLLHPARYASAVLSGYARLAVPRIPFDYAAPAELASVAVSVAVAGALAWEYLRIREPGPIRVLRAAHNGSANDYAAYAVAGTLTMIAVLSLA